MFDTLSHMMLNNVECQIFVKVSPIFVNVCEFMPMYADLWFTVNHYIPCVCFFLEPNETFSENMIPFYSAEDSEKARCICADVMTEEERKFFPQYVK